MKFPAVLLSCCFFSALAIGDPGEMKLPRDFFDFSVIAEDGARENALVRVPFTIAPAFAEWDAIIVKTPDGRKFAGQISRPALQPGDAPADDARELVFVIPKIGDREKQFFQVAFQPPSPSYRGFVWLEDDEFTDLGHALDRRKLIRYMHVPYNPAKGQRERSYKVFHHVYNPLEPNSEEEADPQVIITKGPGGRYTHHRGIFFGFSKVSYKDADGVAQKADIWHCTSGVHQAHLDILAEDTGPIFGRHRAAIAWNGKNGDTFATEHREISAQDYQGGTLIDFRSIVTTTLDSVKLDGDPQHAGFHFRATNEVAASTAAHTYYLRPDGKDQPRATRNWPGNKDHVNLPWNAMSFMASGKRFTVCYLDHPENPKEARFSERDYGRFGSYFVYEVTPEKPLFVRYRLFIKEGEMTVPEVRELSRQFVTPLTGTVERR